MPDDGAGPCMAKPNPDVGGGCRTARGFRADCRRPGEFSVLTETAKSGLIRGTDKYARRSLTGGRLIRSRGGGGKGEAQTRVKQ
jgi:hypothetical protein